MRNMTIDEVSNVSGRGVLEVVAGVVVAYVGAMYQMGKDMAQRDNLQCHFENK